MRYPNFYYKVCSNCVMDTTAIDINFDQNGICNFCSNYVNRVNKNKKNFNDLNLLVKNIIKDGLGKRYDCIVGISGGVDSSFSLLKACELGLRPLAVHLDNGWNSELAQHNISSLVRYCRADLYTHVINWKEYRDYQDAFLLAHVIDIELLMDNAMLAINYQLANKYKIKYILSGTNTSTEGFKIPENWSWFKNDKKNILNIGKKFKSLKPKTFPMFGTFDFIYYELIQGIKWILFPDYFEYSKQYALSEISNKCNYKPYPYKHYESVFTRFYQAYILPQKFGIDKRKLHLSNLIASNQIARKEALKILQQDTYPSEEEKNKDIKYFLKKLGWSSDQFKKYLQAPGIKHDYYKSEKKMWNILKNIYLKIKKIKNA